MENIRVLDEEDYNDIDDNDNDYSIFDFTMQKSNMILLNDEDFNNDPHFHKNKFVNPFYYS
jgi:hypothetical protein